MLMDQRDPMGLTGSGSYYIQRGLPGSVPPTFHGSSSSQQQQQQGLRHLHNQNSPFGSGSTGFGSPPPLHGDPSPSAAATGAVPHHVGVHMISPPPPTQSETPMKRKRGRPRKYGQDGSVSLALSSSSVSTVNNSNKRGRGRPPGSGKKQRLTSSGELMMPSSSGMSFTPHVIVVSIGEDIATKVIAFSQQGPRAICVLSASGAVSTATLLQSSSSPAAIQYEGRFEILALSISYLVPTDGSFRNRTGNLSVSLASPDGRVIGGAIGGPLIAASPVQVIVGSFIWSAPKIKNKKREEEGSENVQDTNDQALDPVPQHTQGQNLIWSTGSRQMDMRHAHADIDLMRG
ncbi:AT-hook motif nuclear-localized protein 9-like [Raphanus sativus]|uniref:AT-hook motif nuclear-localized protein n=1 Tax=Raphanus sativus TaxID=3726 RepID=A0A6J0N395_RAPSA|nr:AT-hook motif nuclear-localized protein 9-like [Raphanus sativus]